jgi:hypothetical protein
MDDHMNLFWNAVQTGYVTCLKWAHDLVDSSLFERLFRMAINAGDLDIIVRMYDMDPSLARDPRFYAHASMFARGDIVAFLHDLGFEHRSEDCGFCQGDRLMSICL